MFAEQTETGFASQIFVHFDPARAIVHAWRTNIQKVFAENSQRCQKKATTPFLVWQPCHRLEFYTNLLAAHGVR